MKTEDFSQLLVAVRSGDRAAADELVRRYEPRVRRVVRLRLRDSRLRRVFDSMDICQSIMASFYHRAVRGEFQLGRSADLEALLVTMARNKLATKARGLGLEEGLPPGWDASDPHLPPDEFAERQEMEELIRARLTPDELHLFELSEIQGRTWKDIAQEFGVNPSTLRIRLSRALVRVRGELRKEADDNGE